jgi:hypothetical protein
MRKFEKKIKIGTKVEINEKWYVVKEVHDTRNWIKVSGLDGSFQRGHVAHFSNKTEKEG